MKILFVEVGVDKKVACYSGFVNWRLLLDSPTAEGTLCLVIQKVILLDFTARIIPFGLSVPIHRDLQLLWTGL